MFRALLKKQFLEAYQSIYTDKKGAHRPMLGVIGFSALMVLAFVSIASLFFIVAEAFGAILFQQQQTQLYFALFGLMTVLLGGLVGMFVANQRIFGAKDNELLFAMPIYPRTILLVRMLGLYSSTLIYGAVVWLPVMLVYGFHLGFSAGAVLLQAAAFLLLTLFATVVDCLFGWIIAKVSRYFKNKAIVTTAMTVLFLVVYYAIYFQAQQLMKLIVSNLDAIEQAMRRYGFFFYWLGKGLCGDVLSFALFAVMTVWIFGLVYALLQKNLIALSLSGSHGKREVYRRQKSKVSPVEQALLMKERKRLFSSAAYLTNTGLGILILPILAIVAVWKREALLQTFDFLELAVVQKYIPVAVVCMVNLVASMDCMTAPSISLEGKNLWILQSMPLHPKAILRAKERLHESMNRVPILFSVIVLAECFDVSAVEMVLMIALCEVFLRLSASFGLMMNLLRPNFAWTNETAAVKQGLPVLFALFGGWILNVALFLLYLPLSKAGLSPSLYLALCTAVIAAVLWLVKRWMNTSGVAIFANLAA